ncbi:hypothetical protein DPMN_029120 [Dreissena polymorpha]|uniref:Uncharacterized protein n=1 Tax=Dreissena polymorpha TaxID=45954 RepID=A0A9D4RFY6_DREPO|nr:hypothetical protein DPMN_029120 [Dreissena polymorpha]
MIIQPQFLKLRKSWTGGTQPMPRLQHCYISGRHLEERKVQGHSLQQVPGPRGAA